MGVNKLTVFLLLLIGLLQYRLWFGDGNLLEFHRLNDRIEDLRQEGDKRRERNAALEAEVMDLKQGLDAVEERARQDLGMIKEGEVFVQVIDAHHDVVPLKPPAAPQAEEKPDQDKPKRARVRRNRQPRVEQPAAEPEPATVEPAEAPAPEFRPEEPSEPVEPAEPPTDTQQE